MLNTALFNFRNVFVNPGGEGSSCAPDILPLARASNKVNNMSGSARGEVFHIVTPRSDCRMESHSFASPTRVVQAHATLSAREISLAVRKEGDWTGGSIVLGAISPRTERAPRKMTPARSGKMGPSTQSFFKTLQCLSIILLIYLCCTENEVKKDHLNWFSSCTLGQSTKSEFLSTILTSLMVASRSEGL